MMQVSDSHRKNNSLFSAMSRFIGAVNNMDQTVMVPNLLRDLPSTKDSMVVDLQDGVRDEVGVQDRDMYGSYLQLKSIRNGIECGVLQGERVSGGSKTENQDQDREDDDLDLEKQFHYHLNGLHAVLAKLTRRANTLTGRYKEEIGLCGTNCSLRRLRSTARIDVDVFL